MNVPATKQNTQAVPHNTNSVSQKLYFAMPTQAEMQQLIEFCKVMATAPFYQKLGPGGVMAIYLTAKEYDLPLMACLNGGLHTFDGKVTFSAIMIDALILKAGHKTAVLHLDEQRCVIEFTRGDRRNDPNYKPLVYEYNLKMAEKAGYLRKNNWQTSPKDMLYSRCLTGGGRKHTPEVFVGVLVTGELVGDDSDSNIQPILPPDIATANLPPIPTESVAKEEPKAIEFVKVLGFDEFCVQHGLMGQTRKAEYVLKLAEATNSTRDKIINHAVTHPDRFLAAFEQWDTDNKPVAKPQKQPKPKKEEITQPPVEVIHSMDELVEAQPELISQ